MNSIKNIKPLNVLYITQFLSSFADNAIFFIILAMLSKKGMENAESYMALVKGAFLFAYIILAPLVGTFADRNPKARVLLIGNIIKGLGVILLLLDLPVIFSYSIVGIGAVIYSPAKYGILPELTTNQNQLHNANSKLESYTILSILTGIVGGGILGEYNYTFALGITLFLYTLSLLGSLLIPKKTFNKDLSYLPSAVTFFKDVNTLIRDEKTHFSLVATSVFWMGSSVLKIAFLAWLSTKLEIVNQSHQAMIMGVTSIGVIIGAILSPNLIPLTKYNKVYLYGILMGIMMFASVSVIKMPLVIMFLLIIGFLGGVFIVPMNTIMQYEGRQLIGTGKTIAIQNFSENSLMLIGVITYQILFIQGFQVQTLIMGTGLIFSLFILYLIFYDFKVIKKTPTT